MQGRSTAELTPADYWILESFQYLSNIPATGQEKSTSACGLSA
jgi:hypothetical protein